MKYASNVSRAKRYVEANDLNERWGLLCKWRKRYARYLVRKYGYTVHMAVQRAFIFGYDPWPYDYREMRCVMEETPRSRFDRD